MAASTGIVVVAGVLAWGDLVVNTAGYDPAVGTRIIAGTVMSAFISAGLDKILPPLGTGLAVLLLVSAILGNGPKIAAKLWPTTEGLRHLK